MVALVCHTIVVSALQVTAKLPPVPKEVVARWVPQDPGKPYPFSGYCAHPQSQQHTVTSDLSDEEKQVLSGAELVGLQVAFRHGARVPIGFDGEQTCFNVQNYSVHFSCGIQNSIQLRAPDGFGSTGPTLKMLPEYPISIGKCGTGRLQDEAPLQFKALAQALRSHYDFEKIGIGIETSRFRSDDASRTQGSMYFLVSALFPDARDVKLHVFPSAEDAWSANANCPEVNKEWAPIADTADLPEVPGPWNTHMAGLWRDTAGTIFKPISHKDCLMEAACTPVPLPGGFTKELFHWALNTSLKRNIWKWTAKPEITSVLVAPALFDLQDMLKLQTELTGPKLQLWATHDTVIISLMVSLGVWDERWPMYAETLILEAYKGKQDFFRILRAGKPLVLPGCNHTICPVDVFRKLGRQELRDPVKWQERCKPEHPHMIPVEASLGMTPTKPWARETAYVSAVAEMSQSIDAAKEETTRKQSRLSDEAAAAAGQKTARADFERAMITPITVAAEVATVKASTAVAVVVVSAVLSSLLTMYVHRRGTGRAHVGNDSLGNVGVSLLSS